MRSAIENTESAEWFIENFKGIKTEKGLSAKINFISYKFGRNNLRIIKVWQKYLEKISAELLYKEN